MASTGRKVRSAACETAGNDGLGGDLELGALDRHRRAATGRVGLAQPVADEADGADLPVNPNDLDRAGQEFQAHAFTLGLAQFLFIDHELGAGPSIHDRDPIGAVAKARPRAVHGGISATDDDDVRPDLERLAEVRLLHEVDAIVDAFEVRARNVQGDCIHGARGDGDPVEVMLELFEGDVDPDLGVEDEPHAQPLDEAYIHFDRFAWQAEGGNADQHRAPAIWQAVEDSDLVTLGRQLTRDRQAGRPGTDHRDPLVAWGDLGHHVRDPGRLVPLDQEALHRPDRQRAIDVAPTAGSLARRRADVRAHRGDRIRLARQDVALLEPALGREIQVAAAVRPHRARFLALDVALEPGRVDRLDEEFRGLVDGQAGVPFPDARGRAGDGRSEVAPTRGIYHRSPASCTIAPLRRSTARAPRGPVGRFHCAKLTMP